jgi:phosphoribosylanthranilate isomerase
VFVKICGTTSEEDALLAVAMGADAIGFVFAPSTRQVSSALVADIVKRLPPEILTVGVFRDESPQRVIDIVNATGLKGVQLHGHEPAEQGRWIRERVAVLIRAFHAADPELRKATEHGADAVLIDSATPGSGQVFDWSLADQVPSGARLVLAGGPTPDNVADAIKQVRPWGVDVVTGVEQAPGRKDARKLRAFIAAAKAAEPDDYQGGDDIPFDWEDWSR